MLFFRRETEGASLRRSYVHALWRHYSMPEDALYLTSNMRNARKTSRGEMQWLLYLSRHRSIRSQYTHPEGQKTVGPYALDGYEVTPCGRRVAYEFLGCLFHGHCVIEPDCPLSRHLRAHHPSVFGQSMSQVYRQWLEKRDCLRRQGIQVECMWECQFLRQRETDPELDAFVRGLDRPPERLTMRDGLRGGRTEAFHLLFSESPAEAETRQLLYIDVCR